MNEEMQQQFMDFGALGYSEIKMHYILGLTQEKFEEIWVEGSIYYEKGKSNFEFQLDRKLMQLAMNGDMKAMDKLERKKR